MEANKKTSHKKAMRRIYSFLQKRTLNVFFCGGCATTEIKNSMINFMTCLWPKKLIIFRGGFI